MNGVERYEKKYKTNKSLLCIFFQVLLWLVAPSDTTKFHPVFVNELNKGRESSSSKKPTEARRKEILDYSISTLLNLIVDDTLFWLSTPSLATEMVAIVKAGENLTTLFFL